MLLLLAMMTNVLMWMSVFDCLNFRNANFQTRMTRR